VSVVVPARDEAPTLRRTVDGLLAALPSGGEIVVVDDGSTDGGAEFALDLAPDVRLVRSPGLGVAGARNYGASVAAGDALVFVDAHVDTPPDWCEPLLEQLSDPRVGAAAPAICSLRQPANKGFGLRWKGPDLAVEWLPCQGRSPYSVPLLPGACFAIRRETFRAVGGFDRGMVRWGSEDAELSLRLWLLGYRAVLVPTVEVAHLFRAQPPYPVSWIAPLHNMLRTALVHFGEPRTARVVEALKGYRDFSAALAQAVRGDAAVRRAELSGLRVRDDDWFFHGFEIPC
jgi:GT2 family glycosyltransferase